MKLTPISEIPPKNKGGMGVTLHAFKKDESRLVSAYVGINPIIGITDLHNSVNLPPVTKRAARGSDFTLATNFGSSEIISM